MPPETRAHLSAEAIQAFVVGAASDAQRAAVDEHLDGCDACRQRVSAAAIDRDFEPRRPAPLRLAFEAALDRLRGALGLAPLATLAAVTEEERAVLQRRLALLAGLTGLLCGAALLISFAILFSVAPEHLWRYARHPHQTVSLAATLVLLGAWWLLRDPRQRRSTSALRAVDLLGTFALCGLLGANAALEHVDTRASLSLALSVGHVLVIRSILVPSSGVRTLGICALSSVGAVALALAAFVATGRTDQVSEPGLLVGVASLWLTLSSIAATFSSRVLFGREGEASRLGVVGQYWLHEKLGEGSMGVVYRATHSLLRRPAAIKLLLPGRSTAASPDHFEREVQLTARLRHPNTIAVFDYGRTSDGVFYYAMEYVDGCDLQHLVEVTGPLPPGRVVHLLCQVLSSLAEAHGLGLIHRDLKPANLMVMGSSAPDTVKVLDFGLVHDLSRDAEASGIGAEHALVGTPAYVDPERLLPGQPVGPASDLYSVAAVGYFLLTGSTVFRASSVAEMLALHREAAPEPCAQRLGKALPEDLCSLLLAGLSKRGAQRPASSLDFREQLRHCRVEPWSDQDAQRWWEATGARVLRTQGVSRDAPGQTASSLSLTATALLERRRR